MCCRVIVSPSPAGLCDLLRLAGFRPSDDTERAWSKEVEDGLVHILLDRDNVEFSVQPAIAAMSHHAGVRQAASLMFKVAAYVAEAADGTIVHKGNVAECAAERGASSTQIAAYPEEPLRFERLCLGFRNVFGSESREAA